MVLYDKTDPNQKPVPIGAPKQSAAAVRSELGGRGGSEDKNKPPSGYRWTASGDLEAIPGGPAEGKKGKDLEKMDAAKEGLDSTLDSLQSAYDALNMEAGLPSKNRNALSNIGSYSASTGVGQTFGRMLGTNEQSYRDIINSSRMMLLNDIKNASGMTAQQMNSNVELQNWLKALGDPTVGYETATQIISNIRKKFIDGKAKSPAGSTGGWAIRPKGQ
jgi:hypothetical protein